MSILAIMHFSHFRPCSRSLHIGNTVRWQRICDFRQQNLVWPEWGHLILTSGQLLFPCVGII